MTWPEFKPTTFLTIATTLGFFGLVAMLYALPVPDKSKDLLEITLGVVGAKWGDLVGYYFGSSSGSAKKTELLSAPTVKP